MASSTPITKPKKLLFGLVPSMRWIPHDIPSLEASQKPKIRNPFSLKTSAPDHGVMRARKASLWIPEEGDVDGDGECMHAQDQSMFFARLPIELRRMVYQFVVGGESVHLTLSTKRRFGHFICDDTPLSLDQSDELEKKECACRVLVGGRKSARLDCGGVAMVRCCRRMYVLSSPLYSPHIKIGLRLEGCGTDDNLLGTQKPSRISTAHTPFPSSI
jgi:hypothetical protein